MVVWKTRDMPEADLGGFTDMYMRLYMVGHENMAQKSDTHLRCENGKASFNWRFRFNVKLPLPAVSEGAGKLKIQAWDWDLLDSDDVSVPY